MSSLLYSTILLAAEESFPLSKTGRPRTHHKELLDVFFTVLATGMQWRAAPRLDFRTAHRHFMKWARAGVFQRAFERIRRLLKRPTRKRAPLLAVDTTFVKSVYGVDVVGPNPTDRGRMGTKMLAVVDEVGLPRNIAFFAANVSDHKALKHVLPLTKPSRPIRVYGDKGFDSAAARETLKRSGFVPRIARRGKATPNRDQRRRRIVERFFSWLDKSRRLIVRYDATIIAYSAWTWMACCRIAETRTRI